MARAWYWWSIRPPAVAPVRVIDQARRELPDAEIVTLRAHDEVETVLRTAAERAEVLGIGGGDGTVACAAAAAVNAGRPLAVFPAGAFNRFAKDIGCADPALRHPGDQRRQRVLRRSGAASTTAQMIVNTASIGAYPRFVRTRERLEHTIGKPLAAAYAMLHTWRHQQPVRICFDNNGADIAVLRGQLHLPAVRIRPGTTQLHR